MESVRQIVVVPSLFVQPSPLLNSFFRKLEHINITSSVISTEMKIKNKASGKANASSEGVKDPSDLPLKPVHTINWAKTHPTSDWVQEAAKHTLGVEDIQSLPKEKDAVLRAALTNYTKEQLVIAIVSAMGGNLPSEIPSSKEAAVTNLIDIIFKNKQHDDASLSAFASSYPATAGNAGDATPVGSVVTLSPAKRRNTTTSSSTNRCVLYKLLMFLFFRSQIFKSFLTKFTLWGVKIFVFFSYPFPLFSSQHIFVLHFHSTLDTMSSTTT